MEGNECTTDLNHDADDALNALDENGFRTLFGGIAIAVADRVLRFDAKQEARSEIPNVGHARFVFALLLPVYPMDKEDSQAKADICVPVSGFLGEKHKPPVRLEKKSIRQKKQTHGSHFQSTSS